MSGLPSTSEGAPRRPRILLVAPAYPSSPFYGRSLPVGLGYLATHLERAGFEFDVADVSVTGEAGLFRKIDEFGPAWVGLSLMSLDVARHYALARRLRARYPKVGIIAGGPHLSYVKEKALEQCDAIDIGVVNEGERALVELLAGRSPREVKGVVYRDAGGVPHFTGERSFERDLDELGFPSYDRFSLASYGDAMQIISSRGCPFQCTFCYAHLSMGRPWRARTAEHVVEEVRYWHARGYRRFNFVDSNFFLSAGRVIRICDGLRNLGLDITISADGIRAADADPEMLRRMKEVGLRRIAVGIESANDDILVNVKKGETLADIERCLAVCRDLGIGVIAFFIIGLPGETVRHVLRSFRLAWREPAVCSAFFHKAVPLVGTELHAWAKAHGYLRITDDRLFDNIAGMGGEVLMETADLPAWKVRLLYLASRVVSKAVRLRYVLRHGWR